MPLRGLFLYARFMKFSEGLISKYIDYLNRKHGVVIERETAELHLASLSQFYLSFSFSQSGEVRPSAAARTSLEGQGRKADRREA